MDIAAAPAIPQDSTVVCVDGITNAVISGFTPDISWSAYVDWLRRRRPDLRVLHLHQPHDWGELIIGRLDQHEALLADMVEQALAEAALDIRRIVILAFSFGGLRAIQVTRRVAERSHDLQIEYLAYVTFGAPFRGTGRMTDFILKQLQNEYFREMLDLERNRDGLYGLIKATAGTRLRILIGEIEHDEIVSASSSLAAVHWLTALPQTPALKWGTFVIRNSNRLRPHDGLLHDPLAIGYIDGLVDGLLPPDVVMETYVPFPTLSSGITLPPTPEMDSGDMPATEPGSGPSS